MKNMGKAFKYGDNIDTDVIMPARYLMSSDPQELKKYCMIDIDEDFAKKVSEGDVLIAGKNFGCGSSREHAPVAIKASGVSCVIAESFARIFYRNSFNIGLPIIESKEASQRIDEGDDIEVDFVSGKIKNITKDEEYTIEAYPEFIQGIIKEEGLVNYVSKKVKNNEL